MKSLLFILIIGILIYGIYILMSCPAGTYRLNYFECAPCEAGTFSKTENQNGCEYCPVGTYSSMVGQYSCNTCPDGTYNIDKNSKSILSCIKCKKGETSNSEHSSCEICPAGTYNDEEGSTCKICPPGTYSSTTGATGISSCVKCDPGKTSNIGSTNKDECNFCDAGTYESNNTCFKCPTRTYSSTGSTECTRCPNDGFSDEGSPDVSYCNNCGLGSYKNNKGICEKCPENTYSSKLGITDESSCLNCSPNFSSPIGSSACFLNKTASLDDTTYSDSNVYKICVDSNPNICLKGFGNIPKSGIGGKKIVLYGGSSYDKNIKNSDDELSQQWYITKAKKSGTYTMCSGIGFKSDFCITRSGNNIVYYINDPSSDNIFNINFTNQQDLTCIISKNNSFFSVNDVSDDELKNMNINDERLRNGKIPVILTNDKSKALLLRLVSLKCNSGDMALNNKGFCMLKEFNIEKRRDEDDKSKYGKWGNTAKMMLAKKCADLGYLVTEINDVNNYYFNATCKKMLPRNYTKPTSALIVNNSDDNNNHAELKNSVIKECRDKGFNNFTNKDLYGRPSNGYQSDKFRDIFFPNANGADFQEANVFNDHLSCENNNCSNKIPLNKNVYSFKCEK